MPEYSIKTHGLAKAYDAKVALYPCDLTLVSNRIYALVGRNGSGKSTLVKLLAERELPSKGTIEFPQAFRIGLVQSDVGYPNHITLVEIESLFSACNKGWCGDRFRHVLNIFNLSLSQSFGALSTGQKAGVKIAVMLAQKPTIWLLDEATLGIDIMAQGQALTALLEFFSEDQPCVLYCTHNINEVEQLADEILVMQQGRIIWQGEKDELHKQRHSISEGLLDLFKLTPKQRVSEVA